MKSPAFTPTVHGVGLLERAEGACIDLLGQAAWPRITDLEDVGDVTVMKAQGELSPGSGTSLI